MEDVVRNMREEYLNEGMDTELLEELKQVSVAHLTRCWSEVGEARIILPN